MSVACHPEPRARDLNETMNDERGTMSEANDNEAEHTTDNWQLTTNY
jgi:hypothetical protein